MRLSTFVAAGLSGLRVAHSSRAFLERRQLRKFRRLVAYAASRSLYYRDLIAEREIVPATCVPGDFPVLTKAILMRNFDRISTDPRVTRAALTSFLEGSKDPFDLYLGRFFVLHTSGSSGEVGIFAFSKADWARGVAAGLRINKPLPKRRRLAFYGMTKGHYAGVSFAQSAARSALRLFYKVEVFDINDPLPKTVEGLNRFRPDVLMGYSSAIAMLAESQRRGDLDIHPENVQGSGEVVVASERALVEETFGVPMHNVYTCTEHLITGVASSGSGRMTIFDEDRIFELKGDHTIVTNLFNYTLPLIRYRMTDRLEKVEDSNPRSPFLQVMERFGRDEQIPRFLNDFGVSDFVSPHAINELFIPGVARFQLLVRGETACTLRVCLEEGLSEAARKSALANAGEKLRGVFLAKGMAKVAIAVEALGDIPVDPLTGKFRLIVPTGE